MNSTSLMWKIKEEATLLMDNFSLFLYELEVKLLGMSPILNIFYQTKSDVTKMDGTKQFFLTTLSCPLAFF